MRVELLRLQSDGWVCHPDRDYVAREQAALVLYFGQTDRLLNEAVFESLRARFPSACLAGCSSGTQTLDASVDDDAVVAAAIYFDHTKVRGECEVIAQASESHACGLKLGQRLHHEDLALVWVLSDGSTVNGTQLVRGLADALGERIPVVGGLAGDGGRFQTTLAGLNRPASAGQVVAIGFYGRQLRHGTAAVGGWDAFGPPRRITRSDGNVLMELDGNPALDLYERYLGDEADGLPGTALIYPLRIWNPDQPDTDVVRTVLSIDRSARSMTFAGDVPQGWAAQLMRGAHERLVAGAEQAALAALKRMGPVSGESDFFTFLVSCVGRRLLMGQRTSDEVDVVQQAVRDALGEKARSLGFYSYGELAARASTGRCELHNQTMMVTIIGEESIVPGAVDG